MDIYSSSIVVAIPMWIGHIPGPTYFSFWMVISAVLPGIAIVTESTEAEQIQEIMDFILQIWRSAKEII